MKHLLTLLVGLILSVSTMAQQTTPSVDTTKTIEYPSFYIVDGDTLGIIISIEQAQSLDNDLELYGLFEKMKISCDSTIKAYVVVVNEYSNQVAILETKTKSLETANQAKDNQIKELNTQIVNYKADLEKAGRQLKLKGKLIANQEKRITTLKIQRATYSIGGGVIGVVVGILIGIFAIH
jgi:predicted RNase H-like nuclease (RuvC/YqgF family)